MLTEQALQGRRILVVEDDYFVASDLCEDLRKHGATVLGPAPTCHYAGLLLMGRGVDGAVLDIELHGDTVFEFAHVLRSRRVPFVFTTGGSRENLPREFSQAPWLQKPVSGDALVQSILSELEGANSAKPLVLPTVAPPAGHRPRSVEPGSTRERWFQAVATALAVPQRRRE